MYYLNDSSDDEPDYGQNEEFAIYGGGPSCGEVSWVSAGDVELDGQGYVTSAGYAFGGRSHRKSKSRGGSRDSNSSDCGECAITVDGPVCSDTKALTVLKHVIKTKNPSIEIGGDPVAIVDAAKTITNCESEECALMRAAENFPEFEDVIINTIRDRFKVSGPGDSTDWLNNVNIDDVLEQFCRKFPRTYHVYFQMINFIEQRLAPGQKALKNISLINDVLAAGKDVMCVVINTDRIGRSGIHWFCLFVDMRTSGTERDPFTIEYFNSSGQMARREVSEWMHKAERELEATDNPRVAGTKYHAERVTAATVQHQVDTDSECGVYALYYIWRRLNGAPISEFSTRIPDQWMIDFRPKMFTNRDNRGGKK
jgi:hypothetical protein